MTFLKGEEPPLLLLKILALLVVGIMIIVTLHFSKVEDISFQFERVQKSPLHITGDGLIAQAPAYIIKGEPRATLIERIIQCESGGDPTANNPNSTARGLLQIIKGSEEFCEKGLGLELDMYNPNDNLLCGEYLMAHGGVSHWEASRHCWER